MMKISIGIDVSKAQLDCCALSLESGDIIDHKVIENNADGLQVLGAWLATISREPTKDIRVTLEATGVYHLRACEYFWSENITISVVSPLASHHFAKSLNMRGKTDKLDGIMLAKYGRERRPEPWQQPLKKHLEIKALTSRLSCIQVDIRREENRLEAVTVANHSKAVICLIKQSIESLSSQAQECEKLIDERIEKDKGLRKNRDLLLSIKGIGVVTSRYLLCEIYEGRFRSAAQCSAFFGLVPVPQQSGKMSKSSLSKGGNRKIKAKLYMAAISAKQYNPIVKEKYDRLIANGKPKMVALCAAMHHLIRICYGVLKHQKEFCSQAAQRA